MILLTTIKPLFAHTDHHLHHSKSVKNEEKAAGKDHHDQMKHEEKKKQQVNTVGTRPVLTENHLFLTSNLITALTLDEYLFLSMITSPFLLYLIKRKIS